MTQVVMQYVTLQISVSGVTSGLFLFQTLKTVRFTVVYS